MNRRPNQSRTSYDSFSVHHTAHFRASTPDTHFFESKKKTPLGRRIFPVAAGAVVLIFVFNFLVNQFVHVSRIRVPVRGLSEAFDGYTILHVSDLKGASFGPDQALFSLALRGESYDAVALTGDMLSGHANAQPLYALIDRLQADSPQTPVYFIAGDSDPVPASMAYAASGSPFAPWVLGAQQRGAQLLSSPQPITREGQTLWMTTGSLLSLDLDTMQRQFEQQYLRALSSGDEIELELTVHNLKWLEETRSARSAIGGEDVLISLSHTPPTDEELSAAAESFPGLSQLILCGHYLGGLVRLPFVGPVFIPSLRLEHYGLFPGTGTYCGLSRHGNTHVCISTGLGSSNEDYPPLFFRLFNPPSVALVTLEPSAL